MTPRGGLPPRSRSLTRRGHRCSEHRRRCAEAPVSHDQCDDPALAHLTFHPYGPSWRSPRWQPTSPRPQCPHRSRPRRAWRPGSGPWSSPTATRRGTAAKLRDHLDYLHGVETFMNTIQGVSVYAIRRGFQDAGIADGDVLIFSELMDSRTLFLTAQCRHRLLLVLSSTSRTARWCSRPRPTPWASSTTCGSAGSPTSACPVADRGQGGTYLLVGPGYDGPLPEGGLLRAALAHQPRDSARPGVHQREPGQRPRPDRRPDQGAAEDLPLRPGGVGQQHRRLPDRAGPARPARPARRVPGSWRAPGWRSTRSRPTTSATTRCSTRWCSWSRPRRSTPSWPASSPRSGSSRTRSSRPTPGCGRSSTRQSAVGNAAVPDARDGCPPDRGLPLLRR